MHQSAAQALKSLTSRHKSRRTQRGHNSKASKLEMFDCWLDGSVSKSRCGLPTPKDGQLGLMRLMGTRLAKWVWAGLANCLFHKADPSPQWAYDVCFLGSWALNSRLAFYSDFVWMPRYSTIWNKTVTSSS